MIVVDEEMNVVEAVEQEEQQQNTNIHPQIVMTEAKLKLQGPRQLILDTETTGFYFQDGDRIIEVGAIEMINRKLTGSSIHIYINPEKPVGDSVQVHGITDEFLVDKPKYAEIADTLFEYLKGAEIIAHNATFDMNFLDMEFKRVGLPALSEVCEVTDTLALAKNKHPGQKNSLDALVRRYEIPARDRTFHGALLDAEILSDVYLAMTGGQVSFDMDALSQSESDQQKTTKARVQIELPVIYPSDEELNIHETWVKEFEKKHGEPCLLQNKFLIL
ncbi:DNA polymerase III subunit epsilon [Acinetobacter baumannii]